MSPRPISRDALAARTRSAQLRKLNRRQQLNLLSVLREEIAAAGMEPELVVDMDGVLANAALVDLDVAADEAGLPRPSAARQAAAQRPPIPQSPRAAEPRRTAPEPAELTSSIEDFEVVDAELIPETRQEREAREDREWRKFHRQRFGWNI